MLHLFQTTASPLYISNLLESVLNLIEPDVAVSNDGYSFILLYLHDLFQDNKQPQSALFPLRSPKSCAFPVDMIVINSSIFKLSTRSDVLHEHHGLNYLQHQYPTRSQKVNHQNLVHFLC